MQEVCIDINSWKTCKKEFLEDFFDLSKERAGLCLSYNSNFENAKILRDTIAEICEIYDISEMWKNRLVLIIDELNNNAIEYGSRKEDINKVIFSIINNKDYCLFNIEVIDSGKWKLTKTAKQMEELKEEKIKKWFEKYKSIRGRWLFLIIEKLVDELYFRDWKEGELIVWINKKIEK